MSKQSDGIYDLLVKTFPHSIVKKEYYIKYKGQKLFFDFFVKEIELLVEVQGQQHYSFISHFHEDRRSFLSQKHRDNLKKEFVDNHPSLILMCINYDEEYDKDSLLKKILDCQKECYAKKTKI
jgi:very-short-patch-repair endonuclease